MRASTVFALTLALLIGLGALVGARWAGYLGRTEPPRKEVLVLVAARNLFPGDVIESSWVKTRPLRSEEITHYESFKKEYLPAVQQAASLRVAKRPIEADAPILRNDLEDMVKPKPLHSRLLPNMRAVNISVEKDQSAGGLIQVGEWVDVYLTSTIAGFGETTTRTALVAGSLRVIAKRNALWNIFAALPDNKPVNFTLEANPYRAGLLEFAKSKGMLTLVPVSAAEQKELEAKREKLLASGIPSDLMPVTFVKPVKADMTGEEARVENFNRGEYAIGTSDMMRVFDLTTPPPPVNDVVVEQFNGLARTRITRFSADGAFVSSDDVRRSRGGAASTAARTANTTKSNNTANSIQFSSPSDCKTCKTCPGRK